MQKIMNNSFVLTLHALSPQPKIVCAKTLWYDMLLASPMQGFSGSLGELFSLLKS